MYEAGAGGLSGDYVAEFEPVAEGEGGLKTVEKMRVVFEQLVSLSHLFREKRILGFDVLLDNDYRFRSSLLQALFSSIFLSKWHIVKLIKSSFYEEAKIFRLRA